MFVYLYFVVFLGGGVVSCLFTRPNVTLRRVAVISQQTKGQRADKQKCLVPAVSSTPASGSDSWWLANKTKLELQLMVHKEWLNAAEDFRLTASLVADVSSGQAGHDFCILSPTPHHTTPPQARH